jgi:hypothetical protein
MINGALLAKAQFVGLMQMIIRLMAKELLALGAADQDRALVLKTSTLVRRCARLRRVVRDWNSGHAMAAVRSGHDKLASRERSLVMNAFARHQRLQQLQPRSNNAKPTLGKGSWGRQGIGCARLKEEIWTNHCS